MSIFDRKARTKDSAAEDDPTKPPDPSRPYRIWFADRWHWVSRAAALDYANNGHRWLDEIK